MTEIQFKCKTKLTSDLSWSKIRPFWIKNVKSRDEVEALAKKVWAISPRIIAIMWESTAFFGEERKAVPMSQEEFLEGSGDFCPVCRSDGLNEKDAPIFGYVVLQRACCLNCNASWKKEYKLSGYRDLKEGENANQ